MFFPVILVRDYGIWGFVAFAIPNIVGAASVGFLRYRHRASTHDAPDIEILPAHHAATAWFSFVTIAFHVFFNGWFVPRLLGPGGYFVFLLATVALLVLTRRSPRREVSIAPLIFFVSVIALFAFHFGGAIESFTHASANAAPVGPWWERLAQQLLSPGKSAAGNLGERDIAIDAEQWRDLACLTPALVFGFLLCPHLDRTLQRGRIECDTRVRYAFANGYGVFFLVMILFTLDYARAMANPLNMGVPDPGLSAMVRYTIGTHMALQSAYTVALHLRALAPETREPPRSSIQAERRGRDGPARDPETHAAPRPSLQGGLPRLTLASILVLILGAIHSLTGVPWITATLSNITGASRDAGEIVYRAFLGCYGLVFPAYAWLVFFPRAGTDASTPNAPPRPSRRAVAVFVIGTLIALPLFAVGSLGGDMRWMIPGVAVPLIARAFLGRPRVATPAGDAA